MLRYATSHPLTHSTQEITFTFISSEINLKLLPCLNVNEFLYITKNRTLLFLKYKSVNNKNKNKNKNNIMKCEILNCS